MVQVQDMTFVIRAAGERTQAAAASVLASQAAQAGGDASAQIRVVEAKPFVNAVRATFEHGLAGERPWTVAMDADVLLLSDGCERLAHLCTQARPASFTITTLVLCKFFGGFCFRGIHLYPTRLLQEALPLIEASKAAESLRPETCVVQAMMQRGYEMEGPPLPVGVHDYEQSYRHIYLKMLMRGRREMSDDGGKGFNAYLGSVLERSHADADFLVASWGLMDGAADSKRADAPAHYDWDAVYPALDQRMHEHGLRETSMCAPTAVRGLADALVNAHAYSADYRTPKWIRDRFGFAAGPECALETWNVPAQQVPLAA
jgi:hypothetical protein